MAANNGDPVPVQPPSSPPGAVVVEPALAPLRKIPPKMDPKKAFEGTSAVDRLKVYLKEIPTIRARLVKVIEDQEENLKRAKTSIDGFDQTTARINEIVKSWEEQKDAGHHAPVAGPVSAGVEIVLTGTPAVEPGKGPLDPGLPNAGPHE